MGKCIHYTNLCQLELDTHKMSASESQRITSERSTQQEMTHLYHLTCKTCQRASFQKTACQPLCLCFAVRKCRLSVVLKTIISYFVVLHCLYKGYNKYKEYIFILSLFYNLLYILHTYINILHKSIQYFMKKYSIIQD